MLSGGAVVLNRVLLSVYKALFHLCFVFFFLSSILFSSYLVTLRFIFISLLSFSLFVPKLQTFFKLLDLLRRLRIHAQRGISTKPYVSVSVYLLTSLLLSMFITLAFLAQISAPPGKPLEEEITIYTSQSLPPPLCASPPLSPREALPLPEHRNKCSPAV